MNINKVNNSVEKLQANIEKDIIKHMTESNIEVYSFLKEQDKIDMVMEDGELVSPIIALRFDGYTLGVMLECDLTPLRREFLSKRDKYYVSEETNAEMAKLNEETEDGFDGFCLLVDSATYPTDTLVAVANYISNK